MPAAITSPPLEKDLKTKVKAANAHARSKKTRIVRRRGRAKDGIQSDDEIEREARTDSDTDDESSSLSSASDVESDSDEDNHATRFEVVTPSTTQSPPPVVAQPHKAASLETAIVNGDGPFVGATDWAQMVADENANGTSDLPVIDFADLNGHAITHTVAPQPRFRKQRAARARSADAVRTPSAPESTEAPRTGDSQPAPVGEEAVPSSTRHPSQEQQITIRPSGKTPRQAYQQRLESDPSFVPKVGGFWGHDDRLLEKDLRSLSGWWRGRWQSHGRGRGFSMRGRGRGGFFGGRNHVGEVNGAANGAPAEEEIPPIERPWTHDGFEEMKKKEERRRAEIQQRAEAERRERSESRQQGSPHPSNTSQRGFPFRGRGGFAGRGGFTRGGGMSSPRGRPFSLPPGRVWYAMKPEKPFTQQHDSFLYFDPALKPRGGQGPGLRIKLPGREAQIVRLPPRLSHFAKPSTAGTDATSVSTGSERSDRVFTVRIPPRLAAEAATSVETKEETKVEKGKAAEDTSIEEVFTVRPHVGPQHVPIEPVAGGDQKSADVRQRRHSHSHDRSLSFVPSPEVKHQLETIVVQPPTESPVLSTKIEETVLRKHSITSEDVTEAPAPQLAEAEARPAPPVLPPIQTSFSPVPQSPPFNGSPYTFPPPLPPGVAMSHHGYPYEVTTGRPVYLQPTPPPIMYNPRPVMHGHMHHPSNGGVPFVPGHMHHPSSVSSPDFLAHTHTPPVNGFIDPSTGVPIFAPPRQSSRVEIRAPSDRAEAKGSKLPSRPSGLRTSVVEQEVLSQNGVETTYVAQPSESNGDTQDVEPRLGFVQDVLSNQAVSPPPMPYNPYAQPYYYPEQYGYNPYMSMSQPPAMHYEMYSVDPSQPRGQSQPILYY